MLLLDEYRCPRTGQPLHPVLPGSAAFAGAAEGSGAAAVAGLSGLAVAEDGHVIYPIVDEVPQLLESCCLCPLAGSGTLDAGRLAEVADEVRIYDALARKGTADVRQAAEVGLGKRFCDQALGGALRPERFPDPLGVWVDCTGVADSQYEAYQHLVPLQGTLFLQIGGSGTHAVKALLAGAARAGLLSPSQEEILLGRALARFFGVESRFFGVRGLAEQLPLPDGSIGRAYGGGCLHHTSVEQSLPELARVLVAGGRASFVDPRQNSFYDGMLRLLQGARFCGEEMGTHDRPLAIELLDRTVQGRFASARHYESGGLLRYVVVAAQRVLGLDLPVPLAFPLLRGEQLLLGAAHLDALFGTVALLLVK